MFMNIKVNNCKVNPPTKRKADEIRCSGSGLNTEGIPSKQMTLETWKGCRKQFKIAGTLVLDVKVNKGVSHKAE